VTMRALLSWIWGLTLVLSVAGCSEDDGGTCRQVDANLYACGYMSAIPGGNCATSRSRCQSECIVHFGCQDFDNWEEAVSDPAVYLCFLACTEYIRCGSGESIPATWRCDDAADCTDGSDEMECE
jgi:hypothetical protein